MTQTPAAERMSELRELLEKATHGEWWNDRGTIRKGEWAVTEVYSTGNDDVDDANAALICAMKNALPSLLDTIERLQQQLSEEALTSGAAIRALSASLERMQDRATQAERALEEIRGQMAWMPIETAPKDGSIVILATQFDGPDDWRIKCGLYRTEIDTWQIFGGMWTPTHWQPLPAPPVLPAQPECAKGDKHGA